MPPADTLQPMRFFLHGNCAGRDKGIPRTFKKQETRQDLKRDYMENNLVDWHINVKTLKIIPGGPSALSVSIKSNLRHVLGCTRPWSCVRLHRHSPTLENL